MCFIPKLNVLSSKKDNEKTHQKPNFFLFIFRNSVDSIFMDAQNESKKTIETKWNRFNWTLVNPLLSCFIVLLTISLTNIYIYLSKIEIFRFNLCLSLILHIKTVFFRALYHGFISRHSFFSC